MAPASREEKSHQFRHRCPPERPCHCTREGLQPAGAARRRLQPRPPRWAQGAGKPLPRATARRTGLRWGCHRGTGQHRSGVLEVHSRRRLLARRQWRERHSPKPRTLLPRGCRAESTRLPHSPALGWEQHPPFEARVNERLSRDLPLGWQSGAGTPVLPGVGVCPGQGHPGRGRQQVSHPLWQPREPLRAQEPRAPSQAGPAPTAGEEGPSRGSSPSGAGSHGPGAAEQRRLASPWRLASTPPGNARHPA